MKTALALAALLFALPARAEWFEKPNATDIVFQCTFTGLMMVDWMQTLKFTQDPIWMQTHRETNLWLGGHPPPARVNAYQIGTIVVDALVAYALPRPYRNIWQTFGIGIEVYATSNNYRLGLGMRLPWN